MKSMIPGEIKIHRDSESFGNNEENPTAFSTVPQSSETFSTAPNGSEQFRTLPHLSERPENHTLTVREVARKFEGAGVARTERSIVNWCQPNRTGIARLDAYFDPNERRYYISPQSAERVIAEEKAKAEKKQDASETLGTIKRDETQIKASRPSAGDEHSRILELERENLDLKITNRAKDMEIARTHDERDRFFDQLLTASHKIGELEIKILQIGMPTHIDSSAPEKNDES